MRSQFYISYFKKELEDHSSGLVCISRLTCMAGQGELTVFPKTELWTEGLVSVHFQFNHSKQKQGLQTFSFHLLNLQIGFEINFQSFVFSKGEKTSFWLNWIESEVKTALDLRVLKLQTTKNPNCWFSIRTAHSSIHIWTDNCEISISRKLQFTKKPTEKAYLCLIILPLRGFGRLHNLIPPALLLEANEFTLTEDSLHRKMTALNEKVLLYCSLSNSKTRAVYSLHGIDYSCKAKPCETKNSG